MTADRGPGPGWQVFASAPASPVGASRAARDSELVRVEAILATVRRWAEPLRGRRGRGRERARLQCRRWRPTPLRSAPARAEEVEVVAPAAPSAPPLESDGYPRRKQPENRTLHPNIYGHFSGSDLK